MKIRELRKLHLRSIPRKKSLGEKITFLIVFTKLRTGSERSNSLPGARLVAPPGHREGSPEPLLVSKSICSPG